MLVTKNKQLEATSHDICGMWGILRRYWSTYSYTSYEDGTKTSSDQPYGQIQISQMPGMAELQSKKSLTNWTLVPCSSLWVDCWNLGTIMSSHLLM